MPPVGDAALVAHRVDVAPELPNRSDALRAVYRGRDVYGKQVALRQDLGPATEALQDLRDNFLPGTAAIAGQSRF